jgi:hypothetical protein
VLTIFKTSSILCSNKEDYKFNNQKNMDSIPGYDTAQPIQFATLDQLLWGIVKTIQVYSLPVMALSIAALGIALVMSGDDTERKSKLKGWITHLLLGGLLVFGAATIASILKTFLGGK